MRLRFEPPAKREQVKRAGASGPPLCPETSNLPGLGFGRAIIGTATSGHVLRLDQELVCMLVLCGRPLHGQRRFAQRRSHCCPLRACSPESSLTTRCLPSSSRATRMVLSPSGRARQFSRSAFAQMAWNLASPWKTVESGNRGLDGGGTGFCASAAEGRRMADARIRPRTLEFMVFL